MIQVHFIEEPTQRMWALRTLNTPPSVGDELRFHDGRFFKVTRLVWVYDEQGPHERLNVGMEDAC